MQLKAITASKTQASFALLLTVLCLVSTAWSASLQATHVELSQPPSAEHLASRSQYIARGSIVQRHGDHEDDAGEDSHEDGEHAHEAMESHVVAHQDPIPMQHVGIDDSHHDGEPGNGHRHQDSSVNMAHVDAHAHGHDHDTMAADGPTPESIPDAAYAGAELRDLPVWRVHKGHDGHSHGSGPVREHLNETLLFRAKGPDPLSYIEWDFGYGLGSAAMLRKFTTDADVLAGKERMGVVDGRWRKLFDEKKREQRKAIATDIAARLPQSQGEPSRHRGLLILHVVTAVLSCFVLLPMALVLRAAHSSLAPFVSLVYLAMLGGSMFLSILYKALTPRLYPDNAHGSMGWAILWISLITLGTDVFRLVGQTWSAVAALRLGNSPRTQAWLSTGSPSVEAGRAALSWRDVVGTMLGRRQFHPLNSESYNALEEEAMLSEEAQSDAQELDVEKHMHRRLSSQRPAGSPRSDSASPLPHRVHFDDHQGAAERTRGGSAESLVEPVDWVGSGSTIVSNGGIQRRGSPHGSENVMVASPTTTACNTPRNSIFGADSALLPPLNFKSIPLWRKHAHEDQVVSPQDATAGTTASCPPAKLRSSRLDTFRSVVRYTRVVVARSLPIVAFATSYTGLAVYTGSCRGGYKNVCLAHGIKGGIFFWFGLLTFGRYLGAYADCGWAWNKRPNAQAASGKSGLEAWRRTMPSAEFVECLVIFTYGATNTWMERFGAAPGDPYTIKQIQHISIAVMFWFAGLMGMLLETKFIRNMLSFPIAYHHVAAVPLQEARRRHNQRTRSPMQRIGDREADADLDLLVEAQTPPASYSASFNPFPALVIGVTGVAMAAHHQDYQYEVEIHMLWGQLLAGFALLRCLTYFLLWLRPPSASVLPSRPPTEALAAFSLCCGGLVFMLSSEEVSFAAMRSGYGDFMAILNVAVAIVSLLFCWTTALMMFKGWAVRREVRRNLYERVDHGPSSHTTGSNGNALRLEVIAEEERAPRHMRASVVERSATAAQRGAEAEPVFVLDDEEEQDEDVAAALARAPGTQ